MAFHNEVDNRKPEHLRIQIMNVLHKGLPVLYGLMMCGILLVCILFPHIKYGRAYFCRNYLPAILLLAVGIVFLLGIYKTCSLCKIEKRKVKTYLIVVASAVIFALQVYSVWNYYFYTDWDVRVLIKMSDAVAHHTSMEEMQEYFSMCPNNLFLAYIFSVIRKAAHFIGFHEHEYMGILVVQCLLNTLTGVFIVKILDELFDDLHLPILGFIIYFVLLGISPWVSIPYSDSMGLIFPLLIVFLYVYKRKFSCVLPWWISMGVLAVIGYKLKPQILIIFLAILFYELLSVIRHGFSKKVFQGLLGIVIGVICAWSISQAAISSMHFPMDDNRTFHIQHYFMMGMNPEAMGVWSNDDVEFSKSFATTEERNAADIQRALIRIKDMGVSGVTKQFVRKTLTNYNDGTYCWSGEGVFFKEVFEERTNPWCKFVRGLYYKGDYSDVGKYNVVWSNFAQMTWLTVLLMGVFSAFADEDRNRNIIMLGIIGLTVFELIFEARSRYLYTYVPLYIILAIYGVDYIRTHFRCLVKRNG